jgi:hypothetical protein
MPVLTTAAADTTASDAAADFRPPRLSSSLLLPFSLLLLLLLSWPSFNPRVLKAAGRQPLMPAFLKSVIFSRDFSPAHACGTVPCSIAGSSTCQYLHAVMVLVILVECYVTKFVVMLVESSSTP